MTTTTDSVAAGDELRRSRPRTARLAIAATALLLTAGDLAFKEVAEHRITDGRSIHLGLLDFRLA